MFFLLESVVLSSLVQVHQWKYWMILKASLVLSFVITMIKSVVCPVVEKCAH